MTRPFPARNVCATPVSQCECTYSYPSPDLAAQSLPAGVPPPLGDLGRGAEGAGGTATPSGRRAESGIQGAQSPHLGNHR
jgi:hypothetical protein